MLINVVDGEDDYENGGVDGEQSLPSLSDQPRRHETQKGVRESGLPPFLLKLYNIVDDSNTNSIISWSRFGTSFTIWNHLEMTSQILPQYFRHNNFSSFIYQLNNYGFRKIGLEQWEYENSCFQAGKKHLLINIKRRIQTSGNSRPRVRMQQKINSDPTNNDIHDLSNLVESSKVEIEKLKQEQEDIDNAIAFFKQHMEISENKSQKLIMFFAKELGGAFLQEVVQLTNEEEECESIETGKKRKFLAVETTENVFKDSDMEIVVHTNDGDNNNSKNCGEWMFWKNLLEDNSTEAEREQSKMAMELDDMMIASKIAGIGKPTNFDADEEINLQLWA